MRSIGEYIPMIDGPEKVSGAARYTADFVEGDALEAAILRSPYAHAEILEVDTSEAEAMPGVRAVVTGADCDKTYGVLPIARGEYPLARGRVRYKGEPVAAVAADDIHIAKAALKKIRLKFKELPAYYRCKDAYAEGAVDLHEHRPGNLERDVFFELGDVEDAFKGSDLVMERKFHAAEVCQAQMEMHSALVSYDPLRDRLTCKCSTQVPYYVHLMLAKVTGMDQGRIRVDQAACRRRLRLPDGNPAARADRRPARAQDRRHGAAPDNARGDLHHPSRPGRKPTCASRSA